MGRRRAESSGGACRARLGGGSPCSSRFAASSRRRVPSAWGAAEPRAWAVPAERDLGAARHAPLASSLVQKKCAVGLGAAEPRHRAVFAERDLGVTRHVLLASPLVQEEGRHRAGSSVGACRARIGGGLLCPSCFAAGSRRKAPSARSAAEPRARAVLAELDLGAVRYLPLFSPLV